MIAKLECFSGYCHIASDQLSLTQLKKLYQPPHPPYQSNSIFSLHYVITKFSICISVLRSLVLLLNIVIQYCCDVNFYYCVCFFVVCFRIILVFQFPFCLFISLQYLHSKNRHTLPANSQASLGRQCEDAINSKINLQTK